MSSRARTPTTPFIPPFGTPEGSPAPVVPGQLHPHRSPNPAQAYLHSPYATTPFIPSLNVSPMGTPGVIPAVIPGAPSGGPPSRQGLSHDFVGYPSGADPWSSPNSQGHPPTPMLGGYGHPMSPWHAQPPNTAPAAYANFSTPWSHSASLPSPWAPNGRGIPQGPGGIPQGPGGIPQGPGGYSPYSAGYTPVFPPGQLPGGYGGHGGHGGHGGYGGPPPLQQAPQAWGMQGMQPQMHPQMAPQQQQPQGHFGGHPDWLQQMAPQQQQGHFGGHPDWLQQAAMQQGGFAPPHAGHPPRSAMDLHSQRTDQIPPFTVGPHYGPVLEPNIVHILGVQLRLNPLLMPLPEDGSDQVHLNWNMLFPTSDVHRSADPTHVSWSKGRDEPATFPRVSCLNIITESMPWIIEVRATEKNRGLTCGEVIDTIGRSLSRFTSEADYRKLSPPAKRDLKLAYQYNRERNLGVPGGLLGQGIKRLDYLGRSTMFAGIEVNDRVLRKLHGMPLPCFVVLKTLSSYPMTDRERRDQEARQRSGSSQGHRSRANSTNTRIHVQSPSSTGGSDEESADYDPDHH